VGVVLIDQVWETDKSNGVPQHEEEELQRRAEGGDPVALYELGRLLRATDRGVDAEVYLRRAAKANNSAAMTELGVWLEETGRGDEAKDYYERAAKLGDRRAMLNLADIFEQMDDAQQAERWRRRASEAAEAEAHGSGGCLITLTAPTVMVLVRAILRHAWRGR
jgi:TPR repeat protein